MRVIADTNVTVSGLLWHGPPNQLLRWCRDGFLQILACEATTAELSRVLQYKRFAKRLSTLGRSPHEALAYYMNLVLFVPTPENIARIIIDDPFDNVFLALACDHKAQLIVSGDGHLLSLKEHSGIQIVTPGEACEVIQALFGLNGN